MEALEESEFMAKLKDLDTIFILFQMENLVAATSIHVGHYRLLEEGNCIGFKKAASEQEKRRKTMPEGIDLGELKHYSYPQLSKFTDDVRRAYRLGFTNYGRLLRGSIEQDSGIKCVTIKTWDLHYPPRQDMHWQPRRLHNEIMFFTKKFPKELNSHPNLPKLIGYTIDKKLGVVYDLKPKRTLERALKSDDFGWGDRAKVAIQIAHLMLDFHDLDIPIGAIDSMNILFDEEDNIKLCDFGLTVCMSEMIYEHMPQHYLSGRYNFRAADLYNSEGKWTVQSDICAFGMLLLQLITRMEVTIYDIACWVWQVLDTDKTSVVDESFLVDDADGVTLTELVKSCLNKNPRQCPTAREIVKQLEDLTCLIDQLGSVPKKPKLDTC